MTTAGPATTRVDFDAIAETVDLPALAMRAGVEIRNGKALCPFHANVDSPALSFFHRGGRWRYKCHACEAAGDAIAWVSAWDGVTPLEAARKLGGLEAHVSPSRPATIHKPEPRPSKSSALDDPEWRLAVDAIIQRGEQTLWSPAGFEVLDYLRSRGLADRTIRRLRLGYNPSGYKTQPIPSLRDDSGHEQGIYVARGVTIPWVAPGACHDPAIEPDGPRWVGCQVRRLAQDLSTSMPHGRKCQALLGSVRGYGFPHADLFSTQFGPPAVICEGEFDAMLAHQEAGDVAHAFTVGGSSQEPHATALEALEGCSRWLLAFDHDEAGAKATIRWRVRAPERCRRLLVPTGKDIGEYIQAGGDLRAWILDELARMPPTIQDSPKRCAPT